MPKQLPERTAFLKAVELVRLSKIAMLEESALPLHEHDDQSCETLEKVRKVLVEASIAAGSLYLNDPDGEEFRRKYANVDDDDFFGLVMFREEAGYLYGLPIGLLLGKGGTR